MPMVYCCMHILSHVKLGAILTMVVMRLKNIYKCSLDVEKLIEISACLLLLSCTFHLTRLSSFQLNVLILNIDIDLSLTKNLSLFMHIHLASVNKSLFVNNRVISH